VCIGGDDGITTATMPFARSHGSKLGSQLPAGVAVEFSGERP
jgi:hypothetical protein